MRGQPISQPTRAVLYLRQSVSREDSISLELQEHEGRAYAARKGYEVVAVEADPGISGRTWKRPAVVRVMEMIDRKEAAVVILWKWSRLSRSRLDWAVAADRVSMAGGRIESATEPIDVSTSTGRFARGMMTEMAAFESERIGDTWRETHARRIRNGLPANGKPRFGYLYTKASGFVPDPLTSPVLGEMYSRYVSGASIFEITRWLNDGPTRPVGGYGVKVEGLWNPRTVRRVMDSGFAAGYINVAGELVPGAQEPILSAEQWEDFQEARNRRRKSRRGERSEYLLSGLVRCFCGVTMTGGYTGSNRAPRYGCRSANERHTHSGVYVTTVVLEAALMPWLKEREEHINAGVQEARKTVRPQGPTPLSVDKQLAAVASKMDALAERLVDPGIPHATYVRLRDKYEGERQALEAVRLTAVVQDRVAPVELIPTLLANWDRMTIPERREILRSLIDYIEVWPGHPKAKVEIHARA